MSEPSACLHLVFRSPRRSNALDDCLALARAGDAVVLLDDGVGALLDWQQWLGATEGLLLAAMAPDLAARGGEALLAAGVVDEDVLVLLDYAQLVQWVQRWPLSQSWS